MPPTRRRTRELRIYVSRRAFRILVAEIRQLDHQVTNGSVIRRLTTPPEIEHDHQHEMVLAQDVGAESPDSISPSDPRQMCEQRRPHAERMIFVGNHYREL